MRYVSQASAVDGYDVQLYDTYTARVVAQFKDREIGEAVKEELNGQERAAQAQERGV